MLLAMVLHVRGEHLGPFVEGKFKASKAPKNDIKPLDVIPKLCKTEVINANKPI